MKILLLHAYGTATGEAELQMLSMRQDLRDRRHEMPTKRHKLGGFDHDAGG